MYRPGDCFELIFMVIMETIQGYFGSEFPAICNHCFNCRVMLAWSRKTWNIFSEIFAFFGGRPLMVKFWKFYSGNLHHDTDWCCCVQSPWNLAEINEIVHYLPDKKFWLALQLSLVYCTDCAQNLTEPAPDSTESAPNWFTCGGVIAECMNMAKMLHKVNPIFYQSLALSRIVK